MTQTRYIMLAMAGSAALLLGAWMFQFAGYAPCKLCVWQRWPHGAAVAIGLVALWIPTAIFLVAGALAALTTAGIGLYHTGIERAWWEGPDSCTSGDISDLSTDALMDQIMSAPLVQCDVVAWQMLGLSMASWNMVMSLVLAGLWACAYAKGRTNI